jgi:hypothetical protein
MASLTINVPTYNRHKAFTGFIDHFVTSLRICNPSSRQRISINILDNCSTDFELKASYFFDCLSEFNIKRQFLKWPATINGDANIIAACELGSAADFTMVAGDDDYLHDNALYLSLELIDKFADQRGLFVHTNNTSSTIYPSLTSLVRELGESGSLFDIIEMCHITNPIFRSSLFSRAAALYDLERAHYLGTLACFSHARGLFQGYLSSGSSPIIIIPFERYLTPIEGLRGLDQEVSESPTSLGNRIYGIYRSFIFWVISETRISLRETFEYCERDKRMHWIFNPLSIEY